MTHCSDCGAPFPVHPPGYCGGTGYAEIPSEGDRRVCYPCSARRESAEMIATGRGVLYLVNLSEPGEFIRSSAWRSATVTDWPGVLRFPARVKVGGHDWYRVKRYDVWFTGPDGADWYGCHLDGGWAGDIFRVRRLKTQSKRAVARMATLAQQAQAEKGA